MPYGSWINDLPTTFFMVVHIAAFAIGATFAWVAFKRELTLLGLGFTLFAAAEVVYMTYHLDWTVFLFAHKMPSCASGRMPCLPRGIRELDGTRPRPARLSGFASSAVSATPGDPPSGRKARGLTDSAKLRT